MMNFTWQPYIAFLGAGGNNPRVEAINTDSGEIKKFIELPPMHSAYALDIDIERGTLAVGIKGGLVYIINSDQNLEDEAPLQYETLVQGAPILSVCWINKSILVASDIAGRCLLWDTDRESSPQPLETMEGVICSLLNLPDDKLAGFSSDGKLLFWHMPEGSLVRVMALPVPPPISALVNVVYWPNKEILACPGSGGHLTLYDFKKDTFMDLEAHEGIFYAISVWDDALLTVGMEDHRLKVWEPEFNKPVYDFEVSDAIISIGLAGGLPCKILLVDDQGKVGIYTLEGDKFELINRLPGADYRIVATQNLEKIRSFYNQERKNEAHEIIAKFLDKRNQVPDDEIDKLHSRLIELDYEYVSLSLRVEQADQNGDIGEALRFSQSLIDTLPPDSPYVCPSMERYSTFLEKTWHLPEAEATFKRILDIDPNYAFVRHNNNFSSKFELENWKQSIIEPDIPIDHIIESATVINKIFHGRFVIKALEPEPCDRIKLSPEIIAEKYKQVVEEQGDADLPSGSVEHVQWFTLSGNEEVELITFGGDSANSDKHLQFVLKILTGDSETVVVPVILFGWYNFNKNVSVEYENERASRMLADIRDDPLSSSYLDSINRNLKKALRRLIGKNIQRIGIK